MCVGEGEDGRTTASGHGGRREGPFPLSFHISCVPLVGGVMSDVEAGMNGGWSAHILITTFAWARRADGGKGRERNTTKEKKIVDRENGS